MMHEKLCGCRNPGIACETTQDWEKEQAKTVYRGLLMTTAYTPSE